MLQRMGNIDDAVPFFGKGFNNIYPLIMVMYTLLLASNFFDRLFSYFGNWKILLKFQSESEEIDGFDPSGVIILQRGVYTYDMLIIIIFPLIVQLASVIIIRSLQLLRYFFASINHKNSSFLLFSLRKVFASGRT